MKGTHYFLDSLKSSNKLIYNFSIITQNINNKINFDANILRAFDRILADVTIM